MKLAILFALILTACGGGSEPLHDANTIPVRCNVGAASGVCT